MKRILTFITLVFVFVSIIVAHSFRYNKLHFLITSSNTVAVENCDIYRGSANIPERIEYNGKIYTVTAIKSSAFNGCNHLRNVSIPNSVTYIGSGAFTYCDLTYVTIPDDVTYIGSAAFNQSFLLSVTIPNSVTYIGSGAFESTPWYDNQPDGLVYAGKVAYKYKGEMPNNTNHTQ